MTNYDGRPSPMNLDMVCDDERVAGPDFHSYILDGLTDPTVTEEHRAWCVAAAERHGIEVARMTADKSDPLSALAAVVDAVMADAPRRPGYMAKVDRWAVSPGYDYFGSGDPEFNSRGCVIAMLLSGCVSISWRYEENGGSSS